MFILLGKDFFGMLGIDAPVDQSLISLPHGWVSVSVLGLCDLVRGVSYSKGEASATFETGRLPIIRANNIDEELVFGDLQYVPEARISEGQRLQVGDVVVAMSSGSKAVVGKAASLRIPWNGGFGAFCGVLRPNRQVDSAYFGLFFQTRHYRKAISDASAGTNINNLKREYFAAIEMSLPPLAEQRRIVAKVEALLARVNAARQRLAKVPAILKRFRQSVLAAACSGRLTADWRDDQTHLESAAELARRVRGEKEEWLETDFEKRPQRDLPTTWEYVALGNLGSWRSGATPSKAKAQFWNNGSVPWVTPKDMKRQVIRDSEDHITERAVDETNITLLPRGSLLFVVRGMILAHSFPVAITSEEVTINQDIRAVSPHQELCGTYLLRALQAECLNVLFAVREATHGTLRLESSTLKSWPIPVPPLSEQHEIVRRIGALFKLADAIEKRVAAATGRAEKLTQAILAKAFRGELVPTEAELARREGRAYEPASALLERIKKERGQQPVGRPTPQARRGNRS